MTPLTDLGEYQSFECLNYYVTTVFKPLDMMPQTKDARGKKVSLEYTLINDRTLLTPRNGELPLCGIIPEN